MLEIHLERGMHELNFGYDTKMEVYTNPVPDMLKLYAIVSKRLKTMKDIVNIEQYAHIKEKR